MHFTGVSGGVDPTCFDFHDTPGEGLLTPTLDFGFLKIASEASTESLPKASEDSLLDFVGQKKKKKLKHCLKLRLWRLNKTQKVDYLSF